MSKNPFEPLLKNPWEKKKEVAGVDYLPTGCNKCYNKQLTADKENGTMLCEKCGHVAMNTLICQEAEFRTFQNEEHNPSRVGPAEDKFLSDCGIGTCIQTPSGRIRTHGKKEVSRKDRAIKMARRLIHDISIKENLPEAAKITALEYFNQMYGRGYLANHNPKKYTKACLFVALRTNKIARSYDDFEYFARIEKSELFEAVKHIKNSLNIDVMEPDGIEFIPRIVSCLELPYKVENLATKILRNFLDKGILEGKHTMTKVAVCILMAAKHLNRSVKDKDIAEVTRVSLPTMRKYYREVKNSYTTQV